MGIDHPVEHCMSSPVTSSGSSLWCNAVCLSGGNYYVTGLGANVAIINIRSGARICELSTNHKSPIKAIQKVLRHQDVTDAAGCTSDIFATVDDDDDLVIWNLQFVESSKSAQTSFFYEPLYTTAFFKQLHSTASARNVKIEHIHWTSKNPPSYRLKVVVSIANHPAEEAPGFVTQSASPKSDSDLNNHRCFNERAEMSDASDEHQDDDTDSEYYDDTEHATHLESLQRSTFCLSLYDLKLSIAANKGDEMMAKRGSKPKLKHVIEIPYVPPKKATCNGPSIACDFSTNGQFFVVGLQKNLYVTDLESRLLLQLQHTNCITSLAMHPLGNYVLSGDDAGRIIKWTTSFASIVHENASTSRAIEPIKGHSKKSRLLCSKAIGYLHKLKRKEPFLKQHISLHKKDQRISVAISTHHWHAHRVLSLAFTSHAEYFVSGGLEGVLVIWHATTYERFFVSQINVPLMRLVSCPESCSHIIINCSNNSVYVVDISSREIVSVYHEVIVPSALTTTIALKKNAFFGVKPFPVTIKPFSPKFPSHVMIYGSAILQTSADTNNEIQIFDVETRKSIGIIKSLPQPSQTHSLPTSRWTIDTVAIEPNGSALAFVQSRSILPRFIQKSCPPGSGNLNARSHRHYGLKFYDLEFRDDSTLHASLNTEIDEPHDHEITALMPYRHSHQASSAFITTSLDSSWKLWLKVCQGPSDAYCCHYTGSCRVYPNYTASLSSDGSILMLFHGNCISLWDISVIFSRREASLLVLLNVPDASLKLYRSYHEASLAWIDQTCFTNTMMSSTPLIGLSLKSQLWIWAYSSNAWILELMNDLHSEIKADPWRIHFHHAGLNILALVSLSPFTMEFYRLEYTPQNALQCTKLCTVPLLNNLYLAYAFIGEAPYSCVLMTDHFELITAKCLDDPMLQTHPLSGQHVSKQSKPCPVRPSTHDNKKPHLDKIHSPPSDPSKLAPLSQVLLAEPPANLVDKPCFSHEAPALQADITMNPSGMLQQLYATLSLRH